MLGIWPMTDCYIAYCTNKYISMQTTLYSSNSSEPVHEIYVLHSSKKVVYTPQESLFIKCSLTIDRNLDQFLRYGMGSLFGYVI